jgi:hypothetical protein
MRNKWIYALFIFGLLLSACAPLGGTLEVGVIPETQETTLEVVPTAIPPTPTLEPIPATPWNSSPVSTWPLLTR